MQYEESKNAAAKKKDFVLYVGSDKKDTTNNNNSGSNGKGVFERNSIQNVEIKIIPFNTPD